MRSASWCGTLSEYVLEQSARRFTAKEVENQADLFAHRAALFYTPTTSIPENLIGEGELRITLPIVTADYTEFFENRAPRSPRFWVDLIQRQTHKIRWRPLPVSIVTFTRYDYYQIRPDHMALAAKSLLDAFKVKANGRSDSRSIFYFGAIEDDSNNHVHSLNYLQDTVDDPAQARMKIEIVPVDQSNKANQHGHFVAGRASRAAV